MATVRSEFYESGNLIHITEILRIGGVPTYRDFLPNNSTILQRAATPAEISMLVEMEDNEIATGDFEIAKALSFDSELSTLQNAFNNWASLTSPQKDTVLKGLVRGMIVLIRIARYIVIRRL